MKLSDANIICNGSLEDVLKFYKGSNKWEISDSEHMCLYLSEAEFKILNKRFAIKSVVIYDPFIFSLKTDDSRYMLIAYSMNTLSSL